uniref:Ig-like domain-containing protein n=1 Tax=Amphiprion ocellaris TaxID=80972 RepID=A0AAQ5X487_AMPOC
MSYQWAESVCTFQIQPSRNCIITASPDGSGLISMKSVKQEDSGLYSCRASNRFGEATCSAELVVFKQEQVVQKKGYKVSVTEQATESRLYQVDEDTVDGNVGSDVSMDCKVSGSQPMTITWFKDEQEIVSGVKFQPEFKDSSAMLRIAWLEKADSGVYTCRANNSAGFKETSGTLYVKGHQGLKEASSSSLELHSVKPSDSAKYTCQVSNDAGKVDCTTVLFVKGACLQCDVQPSQRLQYDSNILASCVCEETRGDQTRHQQ